MSFYKEIGLLMLGTRLKRISDKFLSELAEVYHMQNIPFETPWFPVLYLLKNRQTISMIEISKELDVSHSAVSQIVTNMQRKALISITSDGKDGRKKHIQFTDKGAELLKKVEPVWNILNRSLEQCLLQGIPNAPFLEQLDTLEDELNQHLISKDVAEKLDQANTKTLKTSDLHADNHMAFMDFLRAEGIEYPVKGNIKIIHSNNGILGFADFNCLENKLNLHYMYVSRKHRNRGIAKHTLRTLVDDENIEGQSFLFQAYEPLLFELVARMNIPFEYNPNIDL